jgi:glycosyltransferase involved in cell wall biosynthesis
LVRIVIDTRSVVEKKSGIGNYVESLIKHLVPIAGDVRFVLVRHPEATWPILEHERVEERAYRGETKSVHTLLGLGLAHPFADADLYHAPAELVPLGLRCPWVVTFHDLMWIERPELASAFAPVRLVNSAWYRLNYRRAISGARRVIAISQATADAIGRVYPGERSKVDVVHHGIDFKRYDATLAGSRASLDSIVAPGLRYSLIVGQGSPYKNHANMIRAFLEATRTDPDHRLVLVRRFSRVDAEMQSLLARADVRKKLIAVPFVSDATLLALYRHAVMLLFASHYEGFGLPALEAMAMGTPVLASTAPAVREVVGDAALCAVPTDFSDMAGKIRTLADDESLRERLRAAGVARAHGFTWEKAARQTLAVYRKALGRG